MFDTENVCTRIAKIEHRSMEKDEAEIGLVELRLEINPLTPKLAGELDEFVKATLFSRNDGEVRAKLRRAVFNLPMRPQQIAVRAAPDQGKASFVIDEAKVESVVVTRSKKSSAWTLHIRIVCAPASEHQLMQIAESYLKSRYLTWAPADPGLFDEVEKEERKKKAAPVRGQSVSTGAPAH